MGKIIRKYTEENHYANRQGGGSFYKWLDIEILNDTIHISQLSSIGSRKNKPRLGSGSSFTLSFKEAKILLSVLRKQL